jgi:hypothetical protein
MSVLLEPGGIENKLNALEKKISLIVADLGNIKKRLAILERGRQGYTPEKDGKVREMDDQGCSIC